MIYYVEQSKLYIEVEGGLIADIDNFRDLAPAQGLSVVRQLDATFSTIYVANERLYLDGLALTDLVAWLYKRMPNATFKAFSRRFYKMFPDSSDIFDLVRATFRCATDTEHKAFGESAYFCAKVREAHPIEFAELRQAWRERRLPQ